MMIHASIPADDPERVAKVITELWRGAATPFPPVPGVFVARAGDERGAQVEVGPRGRVGAPGEHMVELRDAPPADYSEVHLNIASPLSDDEVLAIGACDRGGMFKLIELWLKNKFMLEVMNDHEWSRYKALDTAIGQMIRARQAG
ncbi:MAG TPA: hypothetical protein VKQ70_13760 [Caulobacteraceae bacterium]|jgi:hypothetical protein|nr:hypothetical protein [Caulobacteraceae bacterium]